MGDLKIKQLDPSQIRYTPEDGEIIQNLEGDYLIWKDGAWNKINYEGSDINLSLYDMNKQIMTQLPPLVDMEKAAEAVNTLYGKTENEFYMLYGKEISYFTLFRMDKPYWFFEELILCLHSIGVIKAIDMTEDGNAVEIWVMDDNNEATCLYLFPYDDGLVKVGEFCE